MLVGALLALVGCRSVAATPAPAATPQVACAAEDADYAARLERAKADPIGADFERLRTAFICSPQYRPHAWPADEDLATAVRAGEWRRVVELAAPLLERNHTRFRAHAAAAVAHERLGEQAQATYHQLFARGLMRAMMSSGDGRSPDTAYVVMKVEEQYDVLSALKLSPVGHASFRHGARWIDAQTVLSRDGAQTIVYFDVSTIFERLYRSRSAPLPSDGTEVAR